jgi:hypothetical protein
MRARHAFALAAAVSAAIAIAASCAVPGFDLVDGAAAGAGGSAGSGGTATGVGNGGAGACQSAEPPLGPDHTDPGSEIEIVVAVRSIDFGEDFVEENGPGVGYDLDAKCTCHGDQPSCTAVGSAPEECDGTNGRDNAVARLFANLSTYEPDSFNSQSHSMDADMGNWTLLIRVTGYNGGANDEEVTVSLYPSPGLDHTPCAGDLVPLWDGSDRWPVEAYALGQGAGGQMSTGGAGGAGVGGAGGCDPDGLGYDLNLPRYVSELAYVTEHTLVANLPEAGIALSDSGGTVFLLRLVGGFISAALESTADGWFMHDGLLTGRWATADFFAALSRVSIQDEPICRDSQIYGPLKGIVCNYVDIHAQISAPAAPCDAMSFGMGFEAEPAQLGAVVDTESSTAPSCAPDNDPAGDSCDE